MKLDDLRKLSPEQAMQAAAEELTLPADFFDRMWKQESGRGKNMRSPAGARGHFQIMPATQRAWEQRSGTALNPDDFHDALYMASETMRENLAKFKDPVDATRAYNGGWKPAKWDNPETVGYVKALWGDSAPSRAGTGPSAAERPEGWPTLPARAPKGSTAPDSDEDTAAWTRIGTSNAVQNAQAAGMDASRADFAATSADAVKAQARKDATGFGGVVSDALRDPRIMPTWALVSRFDEDREVDPNFDYMARREELEAGLSDDEREYLRENAVSESTATRARAELEYRRSLDQTYGDAGALTSFAGQMAGGMMDPASLVLGLGAMKAFQVARIGSGALAARGAGGAAAASMMAENAAANVLIEGVADVMGEVKTSADYALAATAGAVLAAPFTRGVLRQAAEAHIRDLAQTAQGRAVTEQIAKVSKVISDEPHLTPPEIARKVEQTEADEVAKAVTESTGPQRIEQVIPETVRKEMEDEFTGVEQAKTVEPDTATKPPETTEAIEPKEPENVIQQIQEKGLVTREKIDPATGQTIRLSWNARGPKLKGSGNVREGLTAMLTHPQAGPMEKKVTQYLLDTISKDGLDVDLRITARDARSFMDPNGPQVRLNNSGAKGDDLVTKVHGLNKYGMYSILHEVVHVATYHRINAWEKAAGKLRPEQTKIMSQFQDLFDRFQGEVKATKDKGRKIYSGNGAGYAAKNLHEFAAQFFTDEQTRTILSNMPGKPVAGRVTSALREMMSLVRRILGLKGNSAFDEGSRLIDQMIAMPVDNIAYSNGKTVFSAYDSPTPVKAADTPEFKKWFGKSKVVDAEGKPLMVYHGMPGEMRGGKFNGQRIYFTDSPEYAGRFAGGADQGAPGANVVPAYLAIQNPATFTGFGTGKVHIEELADELVGMGVSLRDAGFTENDLKHPPKGWGEQEIWAWMHNTKLRTAMMDAGFDGVRMVEESGNGPANIFIAFRPEQVKSPFNSGAFDGSKPGILEAGGPANGFNPMATQRARDKWAAQMVQHARDYMARNPIDLDRLNVLTAKIGGVSDGLRLAMSKNPVLQLVASLVTETTTGAAGRKANVAIRSHMLHKKFVGNAMIDYDSAYTVFRKRNGGSIVEDAWAGNVRRKFDQKVTEEILSRKRDGYVANSDASVVEAADALEALFERARVGQIDAGVLGFANLPGTARGYLPQSLDGVKLQAMSNEDMVLLHRALAEQFVSRIGFDKKFAEQFAPFYTERVRRRAMGEKNMDGLGAGGDGLQLVRDTLDEFTGDPAMLDRARAALSTQGQGHTKKRLDVDLLTELRPGLRMMDFYVTNPLVLARSYAKRTAGTVSLTEAGIHGIRGIRELRQAALFKQDGTEATAQELDAFDRVTSEILGTPVAGQVVSAFASNLQLLVGLQRLGGLVFTQAAETFNMIHHLGLRATLSGIPDLPRILGEVGRLKRGEASGNHILTSMEVYGGEFGMDSYKLIAPLDAPDDRLAQYMDQPGLLSRLMRAGGHLQSKISGFRGLMAAQHRMMAEQITMRAARYIRDGKHDVELADMGFTPEIAASLRTDLKHVAKWDANDKLVEFDLTRVSDARTAEAFVQAVHRGTSQIIQGTFIGERNAWFHNDYLRLALQLRTFGLTATEKQWGRTRANHNFAYAAGMMLGQMALSLPLHAARVQLMAAGREDRDKYIKNSMAPAALVRATMNYSSLSGLTGDVLEIMSGVAGGWGDAHTKEIVGARQQSASVGRIVPIAGSLDAFARVAQGKADLHTALKQLPFSNLWYLVPAINLTKD